MVPEERNEIAHIPTLYAGVALGKVKLEWQPKAVWLRLTVDNFFCSVISNFKLTYNYILIQESGIWREL